VRRDFKRLRDGYPRLHAWGQTWVQSINALFHQNGQRLQVQSQTDTFAVQDRLLRKQVNTFAQTYEQELTQSTLHPVQRKVLLSLRTHWPGLMLFVEHPEIPMDNNEAERRLRNPVIGRKNYYGSGSLWSGRLSAMLFTIFQTLLLNQLDPQKFLTAYFEACAQNAGRPPQSVETFLPWKLSEEQKTAWRYRERPP
jgi:transposase